MIHFDESFSDGLQPPPIVNHSCRHIYLHPHWNVRDLNLHVLSKKNKQVAVQFDTAFLGWGVWILSIHWSRQGSTSIHVSLDSVPSLKLTVRNRKWIPLEDDPFLLEWLPGRCYVSFREGNHPGQCSCFNSAYVLGRTVSFREGIFYGSDCQVHVPYCLVWFFFLNKWWVNLHLLKKVIFIQGGGKNLPIASM